MKIDLKQELKDFEGNTLTDNDKKAYVLGKVIANMVVTAKGDDPMRAYTLAQKIYKLDELILDKSDMGYVKDAVKESKIFGNYITGQVLSLIE